MNRSNESILDVLKRHSSVVERLCKHETYPAGTVLFREGEEGDCAFVIEKGEIIVSREIGGREKGIGVAGPGDIVGEISLFSGNPRTAGAATNKELRAIVLTRDALEKMKAESPSTATEIYESILKIVTSRLRGAIDHYEVIYHLLK